MACHRFSIAGSESAPTGRPRIRYEKRRQPPHVQGAAALPYMASASIGTYIVMPARIEGNIDFRGRDVYLQESPPQYARNSVWHDLEAWAVFSNRIDFVARACLVQSRYVPLDRALQHDGPKLIVFDATRTAKMARLLGYAHSPMRSYLARRIMSTKIPVKHDWAGRAIDPWCSADAFDAVCPGEEPERFPQFQDAILTASHVPMTMTPT